MTKGKLVVIEGSDGSGKSTQMELLISLFKKQHIPYGALKFPQYHKTFFGKWIARFLKGEFGPLDNLSPYLVMFPYAADRWQAKAEIEDWLKSGKIVISDRYATSCVYQAAKVSKEKQQQFIDLSYSIEYEAFGIPKEDLVLYLHVPVAVTQKLLTQKGNRKYMGNQNRKDLYESDIKLLYEVEKNYLTACKKYPHWVKIDCVSSGQILPKEDIHQKIAAVLRKKKII